MPMRDEIRDIPTDQIVAPWVILRPVNRASVDYLELRDSVAAVGFINSICVRPSPRKAGLMEVVEGLHRHAVACELKLPAMPCIVKHGLTDEDVLALQIQGNALRPETTPLEYAKQIRKIMQARSAQKGADVGIIEVSNLIHKNPTWIGQQLGLLSLHPKVQKTVARGEVPLESAYALTRVISRRQCQFLDLARTMSAKDFVPLVAAWVKRYKEAVRQGKLDDFYAEFSPQPHLRWLKEVLAEYERHDVAASALTKRNCQTPLEGWRLALQWVLHLDPESVNEQRERVAERLRTHTLRREADTDNEDD